MNESGTGGAPEDDGTWTSETLPMAVRRELLERELKKLGLQKTAPGTAVHRSGTVQKQQQQQQQPQPQPQPQPPPQGASEHPHVEGKEDDLAGKRSD